MVTEANDLSQDPFEVQLCRKLWRSFVAGRIWFEEYAQALTTQIIGAPMHLMEECIREIPPQVLAEYQKFLKNHLEAVDFKPCPLVFLAKITDENIENKKKELRPKYIRLYELIKEKSANAEELA